MASSRVVLNLAKLDQVQQALAMGCLKLLETIAREASDRAPDAPPLGQGLVKSWGAAVYVDGKKVGDVSADGTATAKPRAFRAGSGLTGLVGFGFPARFVEIGTSDTRAQPFLTPAAESVRGRAIALVREGAAPLLAKP